MASLLLLLSLSAGTQHSIVHQWSCDVVELNHVYDEDGRHMSDQLIFYNWDGEAFRIATYRLLPEKGKSFYHQAIQTYHLSRKDLIFIDGSDKMVKVRFGSFRESWTQFDPEVSDRKVNGLHFRKEL